MHLNHKLNAGAGDTPHSQNDNDKEGEGWMSDDEVQRTAVGAGVDPDTQAVSLVCFLPASALCAEGQTKAMLLNPS